MRSRYHVGEIDHRLGIGDLSDQKRDDSEPTVTFSQRRGSGGERAQNVGAFDENESAGFVAQ
jgi:hypothetical protein